MTDSPTPELAEAGWVLSDDGKAILKTFRFRGFRDAMAWMARAAFEAEHLNHHPEWSNVYNRVYHPRHRWIDGKGHRSGPADGEDIRPKPDKLNRSVSERFCGHVIKNGVAHMWAHI
jgi:hypothetical protein